MFIVDFLCSLSAWLLGVVLLTLYVGGGLASLWAVRRWVMPRLRCTQADSEFASAAVQCAMLLYALIAALIAVGVWQRHSQVSDIVSSEAAAIASLWRDLGGYPEPTRVASRDTLRGYTDQVISEAWPLQRQGKVPSVGVVWMDRLQAQLFGFEPANDAQKIVHAEVLRAFNNLTQYRRQRLDWVGSALPGVFWLLLLPGAMLCTTMLAFFRIDDVRFHALMVSFVAAFLAMVLFVILALDRPFSGATGLSANSYQLIYDHHMRDPAAK